MIPDAGKQKDTCPRCGSANKQGFVWNYSRHTGCTPDAYHEFHNGWEETIPDDREAAAPPASTPEPARLPRIHRHDDCGTPACPARNEVMNPMVVPEPEQPLKGENDEDSSTRFVSSVGRMDHPTFSPKVAKAAVAQTPEAYAARETAALRAQLAGEHVRMSIPTFGKLIGRAEAAEAKLREQEAELARLRKGLAKIVEQQPKDEPEEKDSHWGNEDDAEYHGYKCAAWVLGKIAREALSPNAGEPQEKK